jgi:pullulanase
MLKQPQVLHAFLEGSNIIVVKLSEVFSEPVQPDACLVVDQTTGEQLAVAEVAFFGNVPASDLLAVTLEELPDVTHILGFELQEHGRAIVTPRNVLNDARYYYGGNDLGASYTPNATAFRVWAPTASAVSVLLYNSETGPLTKLVEMHPSEGGTWYVQVQQNVLYWYYLYLVTIHGSTQTAVDPYARALAVNAGRAMIVDLQETHPAGWEHDKYVSLAHPVDAIIYELHVRDFSIAVNSGMTYQGQYLAFTEEGTKGPEGVSTGVDSLKELGITHVQVLPIEEFASIDEYVPGQYNWGYDPRNFNVPEGAYATTPHGLARIKECKRMVQSLHRAGIGVVMDVVYNHTFAVRDSDFDRLVPQYYYRTNYAGYYTNGSGVGNELATERPMVQKFVCDSLMYWAWEYHIDGFRFDLMALLGTETMQKIAQDLHSINPAALIYGEPWTGSGSELPGEQLLTKGCQKGLGIGVFNDGLRNALAGSVFDGGTQGFVTGATDLIDAINKAVEGSINEFTAGPGETINYVTSHDNYTLWDKIAYSNGQDSEEDRIKMDELAQAVIMTAQGVAFMQGGEEFLRTKHGNNNSYNAGDAINAFDWGRKAQYKEVFDYYTGLIRLRRNHPAFRLPTAEAIQQHLAFVTSPLNTVAFELRGSANGDSWASILVIYNPNRYEVTFSLPAGNWNIVATQGRVGEEVLGQATEMVEVPPICCMILYQNATQAS